MDAVTLLREQIRETHEIMEGTMADVTEEQSGYGSGGKAAAIGAQYAHAVVGEDFFVNTLKGSAPLAASSYAGKSGMSDPPPMGPWDEWAQRVKVDLPAAREYAQAVYQNTDDYLASLKPDDLDREVDMGNTGLGKRKLAWVLSVIAALHPSSHCGEISCLKGMQGARGYPF